MSLITQKYFRPYSCPVIAVIPLYDIGQVALRKINMIKIMFQNKSIAILLFFKNKNMSSIENLFVPGLPPSLKHPTVFKKFDLLEGGQSFIIVNDHDPKPLYYQLLAERGNIFSWEYLEQGPEIWKVHIKKNQAAPNADTVGQIAAKDIRKAEVFKKLGIDFCCGGKKSLKQACEEKGLELSAVEEALEEVTTTRATENFDRWNLDFLVDYIYNKHHQYYYDEAPIIGELVTKVAGHHGESHPELQEVYRLYVNLAQELNSHFAKEEKVLFPFVKALVRAKQTGKTEELINQFSLSAPIQMMESDHDAAGELLEQLSEVTSGYRPPAGACNSFQFLYKKLKDLEDDLHQHIHLENNILFPKALALEKELRN
jgi:regulator of cell morphogenesis and NO signaling